MEWVGVAALSRRHAHCLLGRGSVPVRLSVGPVALMLALVGAGSGNPFTVRIEGGMGRDGVEAKDEVCGKEEQV